MKTTSPPLPQAVQAELDEFKKVEHHFQETEFSKGLPAFFQTENITNFNRIIIMGLGPQDISDESKARSRFQLAFIKQVAGILSTNGRKVDILTTEPYVGIPRPDPFPGIFNALLRYFRFTILPYDHEFVQLPSESNYIGEVVTWITSETLFYAPNLCCAPTGSALLWCRPGLFIGTAVDSILASVGPDEREDPWIQKVQQFKDQYIWKLLPEYDGDDYDWANLSAEIVYRPSNGGEIGDGWNGDNLSATLPQLRRCLRSTKKLEEASAVTDAEILDGLPAIVRAWLDEN